MVEEEKKDPAAEDAVEPEAPEEPAESESAEEQPEHEAAEEQPEPDAAEEPAEPEPSEEAEPEASEQSVQPEAAEKPAAEAAEADLDPKARHRLERSRASGPPRPARTPQERAMELAQEHRAAGERRRRYRAARRRKRGEPGTGTPLAPREPGPKKVRQGTVVSAGGDKTITVEIAVVRRHPTYEKVVRRTSKLHAHDEANQAQEGDVVRIVESRPLSRTKRWRLLEILEKAR
jgi:small subunit ribosomal protein S17